MVVSHAREVRRGLAALGLAAMLSALSLGSAFAARDTFDLSGTVIKVDGPILTVLTSDLIGKDQPIMVDISWLMDRNSELRNLQIQTDTPISLTVMPRESDTFLATGVIARGIVRESPFVNGLEFGVREEFTTRQDSIEARVGNVPVDDEALAQKHRQHWLRLKHQEKDDDDDEERRRR